MNNAQFIDTLYNEFYTENSLMRMGGKMRNYAQGGELVEFKNGGSHEGNPYKGIPLGQNTRVEEGETKHGNYVYSDRLTIDDNIISMFDLPKKSKGKTFAELSKTINSKYKRENDPFEKRAKDKELNNLKEAHEATLQTKMGDIAARNGMELNPDLDIKLAGGVVAMMAAPAIAEGVNLIRTANNKPVPKDLDMFNTNTEFKSNLINRDQIKTDIRSSEATAAYDIKNASGGNAGRYLANRTALNSQANINLAQANLQSDIADASEYARVEGMNFQQDSANQGKRMQVQNWNDADIAAWEGTLQDSIAGLGQNVGAMGTQFARQSLLKDAYGLNKETATKTPVDNSTVNWDNPYTPEAAGIAADELMSMKTAPESFYYNETLGGIEGNFNQYLKNTGLTGKAGQKAFLAELIKAGKTKEAEEFKFIMNRL